MNNHIVDVLERETHREDCTGSYPDGSCTCRIRAVANLRRLADAGYVVVQAESRETQVAALTKHLHRKGVGCEAHRGDDPDVAGEMHRDDAYDIFDHITGAAVYV